MSVLIMIQALRPGVVDATYHDLYWKSPNSFHKGWDRQSCRHSSVLAIMLLLYISAAMETQGQNCRGKSGRAHLSNRGCLPPGFSLLGRKLCCELEKFLGTLPWRSKLEEALDLPRVV